MCVCVFFTHLFFVAQFFFTNINSIHWCTFVLWFLSRSVTNVLTAHPNTLCRFFSVWFLLLHSCDSLLNECISQTQNYCACSSTYTSYIQALSLYVCVVCFLEFVCMCASEMLSTPTAFYEWFSSFVVVFFTTEIFMFPQFYMFVAVFFKLSFTFT